MSCRRGAEAALVVAVACGSPERPEPLVDLVALDPRIAIDLTYARADNFAGEVLYDVERCLVRASVAALLSRVQDRLEREGLGLVVWDAYRPLSVQRRMWAVVPDPRYVADPARGSRHNRGAAVDVSLVDADGQALEMPTGHDDFTPRARRDASGAPAAARARRDRLIAAMQAEGFTGIDSEWWHFDAPGWERHAVLDVPLSAAVAGR